MVVESAEDGQRFEGSSLLNGVRVFLNAVHPDLDADQDAPPGTALSLQPDSLEGLIDD
jgi:hypothetical protein